MSALHSTAICEHGIECASDKAGHSMTFMRLRCSHVDKVAWVDASVVEFDGEWAVLQSLFGAQQFSIWNHEDLRSVLSVNDLVSVNTTYSVLALDDQRYNVAVLPDLELQEL